MHNYFGGHDKNWTYDLYDVNVAFYHWTTCPKTYKENFIMQEIAEKNELKFVDCDKKIPKTDEYFLDTIHFTPKGMRFIAEEIGKHINV